MNFQRIAAFAAICFVAASLISSNASAEQYVRKVQGREVVVHTNPVPVVLHRIVPPFHGKHVTARQLQNGRMPLGFGK